MHFFSWEHPTFRDFGHVVSEGWLQAMGDVYGQTLTSEVWQKKSTPSTVSSW